MLFPPDLLDRTHFCRKNILINSSIKLFGVNFKYSHQKNFGFLTKICYNCKNKGIRLNPLTARIPSVRPQIAVSLLYHTKGIVTNMNKLVIFDLDGTLNQTRLYAVEAVRRALAELGVFHFTDEDICAQFGARPADYVRLYLPDGDEILHQRFLSLESSYEDKLMKENGRAFDGARESMEQLRSAGYRLAICSNSSERYIRLVLTTIGLIDLVDEIQPLLPGMLKTQTLDLLLQRVKPEKAVMVGDRVFDQEAARENKIPFIGCAYGYNPEEMAGSDRVVTHAGQLYSAVTELIG
jgi:phosphoglycolate phosphatase